MTPHAKRFKKLCMGQLGLSRNDANKIIKLMIEHKRGIKNGV